MDIKVKRIARKETYTIGKMYIDGAYFCDTLEDRDRFYFGESKVPGTTAIPTGRYLLNLNTVSPRFSKVWFYQDVCEGKLPRLMGVPNFEGVLVHCGNSATDTEGCILVGKNLEVGKVLNSRATFMRLMQRFLNPAKERKETVYITIS